MPKILYFVTEDWFFASHFLPMARSAKEAGFEVVVATRVRDQGARILAEGYRLVPMETERRSYSATTLLRTMLRAHRVIRQENPDIVHCIALRMAILAGVAARLARAKGLVLAPTGLGYAWSTVSLRASLLRSVIRLILGRWLRGPRTWYLFENHDDPREFGLDVSDSNVTVVHGAGVDPDDFAPSSEPPSPPFRIAVVSRMLQLKGIREAVEAVSLARSRGAAVELDLYGSPDPGNPASIPDQSLAQWASRPGIAWHGWTKHVAQVWREHHLALFLTTYREGVPRALIEAAASGRPIVATDVVGCRDVVRHGESGLLVPPGEAAAAAQAIETLIADRDLRCRLGEGARARFLERFTEDHVRKTMRQLYANCGRQ